MALRNNSKTIQEYKVENADRFSLGLAINNAAVIAANKGALYSEDDMQSLILKLFKLYKKIRIEVLGY